MYKIDHKLQGTGLIIGLLFICILVGFGIQKTRASDVLLHNIGIIDRKNRGANESRRFYTPDTGTKIYTPKEPNERERKIKIAENYIIKAYPKEFKLDSIIRRESKKRLKWPLSYKTNKQKIIIHHTAQSNSGLDTLEKERQAIQDIYKFHTFSRKRGDIGYNYLIGPSGRIYEGRYGGSDVVGAHATRNNTDSIGISLLGNFDLENPSKEQIESLKKLLVALGRSYAINPMKDVVYHTFDEKLKEPHLHHLTMDSIIGHKDVGNTSCPGETLYKLLPNIKRSVAQDLGYVGSTIRPTQEVKEIKTMRPTIKRKINRP